MWNVLAYHIPLDMMNSKLDCESVSQESRYYNKQCRCIKSNKTLVRQYAINKDTNLVCKSFIYSFPKIKQRSQLFFTQFPSRQTGVNRCGMTSTSWQHRIGLHFTKSLFSTKVVHKLQAHSALLPDYALWMYTLQKQFWMKEENNMTCTVTILYVRWSFLLTL